MRLRAFAWRAARRSRRNPFGVQSGLARALLATSTFIVLAFNEPRWLLHDPTTSATYDVQCDGLASLGLFCQLSDYDPGLVRVGLAVACVPAIIGFLPAVSGVLHACVAFSVANNTFGIEGGDHLIVTFSVVLAAVGVFDSRLWAWVESRARPFGNRFIPANVAQVFLSLQLSFVYFEAGAEKMVNPIWSEGTALWYWAQNAGFGATPSMTALLQALLDAPIILVTMTWGVVAFELCIAVTILAARHRNTRLAILASAVVFHLLIASVMGLVTFFFAMAGALVAVCWKGRDAMPFWLFRMIRVNRGHVLTAVGME